MCLHCHLAVFQVPVKKKKKKQRENGVAATKPSSKSPTKVEKKKKRKQLIKSAQREENLKRDNEVSFHQLSGMMRVMAS